MEDESGVVPKKKKEKRKKAFIDIKSMSIKPSRWIDFRKITLRVTVHVELDGDDTSIYLLI